MKNKIKLLCIVIVVFIVSLMVITIGTYRYHFNKRIEHENTYLEYITNENPLFKKEAVSFTSNDGQVLSGAFYSLDHAQEINGLLIWVHGMGVSHENYLAEIEYFVNEGYLVFSYDNTGVENSEGDSLIGLTQAPIDLQHALIYLEEYEEYENIPHILIGHSWGGFAVSAVSNLSFDFQIDGIISLAGFYLNVNIIEDIAKLYVGDIVGVLHPFLVVYEKILFHENANLNGIDGLYSTNAEVLIIHSEDDNIVSFENNFMVYKEHFDTKENFTFIAYEDAGHKLTINKDAYECIHDIMHDQAKYEKDSQKYQELNDERLSLIKDFNDDVMGEMLFFINRICISSSNEN